MERILDVNVPEAEKAYEIFINNDEIESLYKKLLLKTLNKKRVIIFSEKVYSLYGKTLPFPKNELFILKDGENQKNIKNYLRIINFMIKNKISRNDVIIAIGGGVVGDLAGFVASTYMRGISFIQVPTTLLAMVDSSVGGKTAIDLPSGKNLIGAFYQPESVYININFLKTLDDNQFQSGLGEVLKYAFIEGNCCFNEPQNLMEFLITNVNRVKSRDIYTLERLIFTCLTFKSNVVKADEKEAGLRKVLNLGHTYGHAIETLTNYKKYTHGQCVAMGILFIFNWALKNCYIDEEYYKVAINLLALYDFKTYKINIKSQKIIDTMLVDKKNKNGNITFVAPLNNRVATEKQIESIEELKNWIIQN